MKFATTLLFLFILLRINVYSQALLFDFTLKEPASFGELQRVNLWATQYYIHQMKAGGGVPIVYENGEKTNVYVDTCDFCAAALEGTAQVTDEFGEVTLINFASRGATSVVDCRKCVKYAKSKLAVEEWGKIRWEKAKGYGNGVQNYRLVPFRTIAVDPAIIPFGTVIYIPEVRGKLIMLPNGDTAEHDGYFFAGDKGGAIKQNHIDIFTGIFKANPFPSVMTSVETQGFDAYLVNDEKVIEMLTKIHLK